jgi:hypothetical protein
MIYNTFENLYNISRSVYKKITMKLITLKSPPASWYFLLDPNILFSSLLWQEIYVLLRRETKFHVHPNQ